MRSRLLCGTLALYTILFSSLLPGCGPRPCPDAQYLGDDGLCHSPDATDSRPADADGDGVSADGGDCDDERADVNPGVDELPTDGIDNDCDGATDESDTPDDVDYPAGDDGSDWTDGCDNPGQSYAALEPAIEVPVTVVVVRENDGSGTASDAGVDSALSVANAYFSPLGISFVAVFVEELRDSRYASLSSTEFAELRALYPDDGTLHFFVVGNGETFDGKATFAGTENPGIVVEVNDVGSDNTVTTHELGHYFGLRHTHQGTYNDDDPEYVNGSNCESAGDHLCDTPADPGPNWMDGSGAGACEAGSDCSLTCGNDANDDGYAPDVGNVMSYYSDSCNDGTFTVDQVQRMLCHARETYDLAPGPTPSTPQGASVVYDSSVPWNYFTWEVVDDAGNYVVYWGTSPGVDTSNYSVREATWTADYGHTGVVPGSEYCYRVSAENSYGESSLSTEVCVTVPSGTGTAPGTPTNATVTYDGGVPWNYFSWDAVTEADNYIVYWGTSRAVDTSNFAGREATETTEYGHSGVVAGSEYCYRVSAENSYGESSLSSVVCVTVPTSATDGDGDGFDTDADCDDGDSAINPGADEVCDGADNDCDGDTDDDDSSLDSSTTTTWYDDDDGDGYGESSDDTDACDAPAGHVADNGDCDDTDGSVNPGEAEVCSNSTDDDCDGSTDEGCGSGTGTVELCVYIASSSGYTCSDWVTDGAAVAGESCELTSADDGQLWVSTDGWDSSPVGAASGSFTEICATVSGSSGDVLYVNGRFDNTLGQTPDYYFYGEWWWCANWYGDGATAGTFTIDGTEVTPTLYAPGTGGYDCLLTVP